VKGGSAPGPISHNKGTWEEEKRRKGLPKGKCSLLVRREGATGKKRREAGGRGAPRVGGVSKWAKLPCMRSLGQRKIVNLKKKSKVGGGQDARAGK